MKIKEVMKQTGLSEKTVRYYESMKLICPKQSDLNGRRFREYSDRDIAELKSIAVLRKARFSIEDIRQIQNAPECIPLILSEYKEALEKSYAFLGALREHLNAVQLDEAADLHALADLFEPALTDIRLPEPDLKFNFRLLDQLEEERVQGIARIPLLRRFGWTELYSGNDSTRCTELQMKLNEAKIPSRISSYTAAQRLIVQNNTNNMLTSGLRMPTPTPHAIQEKLLSRKSLDNYKLEVPTRYLSRARAVL